MIDFRPGDVVRVKGNYGRLTVTHITKDATTGEATVTAVSVRTRGEDVRTIDTYELPPAALALVTRDGPAEELHDICVAYGSDLTYETVKGSIKRGKAT